jgi:hypothetical protein
MKRFDLVAGREPSNVNFDDAGEANPREGRRPSGMVD